jgi:ABC-type phosphate/phosphonate transport system substrate-binding protein
MPDAKKGGGTMNETLGRIIYLFLFGVVLPALLPTSSGAAQLRIAYTQDQKNFVQKYTPLMDYLAKKGIVPSYEEVKDYPAAATLFASGGVDAMFCGSGVAGAFMISELAVPLVRPVDPDGYSTYWTVVLAPKGSPTFVGSADYFKGKKVAFTSLDSSGEFYFDSLPGAAKTDAVRIKADSHGDAIEALDKGQADIAIVKSRVWDSVQHRYPNLTMVGEDRGENPDNTLIVSVNIPISLRAKIAADLIAMQDDPSPEAQAAKKSMKISGFIKTTDKDFEHTLALLKKAGVTRSFMFARKPVSVSAVR